MYDLQLLSVKKINKKEEMFRDLNIFNFFKGYPSIWPFLYLELGLQIIIQCLQLWVFLNNCKEF